MVHYIQIRAPVTQWIIHWPVDLAAAAGGRNFLNHKWDSIAHSHNYHSPIVLI